MYLILRDDGGHSEEQNATFTKSPVTASKYVKRQGFTVYNLDSLTKLEDIVVTTTDIVA